MKAYIIEISLKKEKIRIRSLQMVIRHFEIDRFSENLGLGKICIIGQIHHDLFQHKLFKCLNIIYFLKAYNIEILSKEIKQNNPYFTLYKGSARPKTGLK